MKPPPTATDLALAKIGKLTRSKRGERTQVQIQQASGIPQSVLSRIENGDYPGLTFDLVLRLCLALDCQASDLLDLDDIVTIARYQAAEQVGAA